jgi:hypothetical protein
MLIGFLLAVVAALVLGGSPGRAQAESGIAADEQGVYILNNGSVRYIEKQKCLKECRFYQ